MKKRNWLIAAGAALAVIIAFCLWYTRPRSWGSLTGPVTDEVASLSGGVTELYRQTADDGRINSGFRSWLIQQEEAEGPATQAILDAFQSHSYRKSLRNLNPWDDKAGTANVVLTGIIWSDKTYRSFSLCDDGQLFCGGVRYSTDAELYRELAAIIQEYGTLQN